MNKFIDFIKEFKTSFFLKEFSTVALGFAFMAIINNFSKISILRYSLEFLKIDILGVTGDSILLVIFSYIMGRLLALSSHIVLNFYLLTVETGFKLEDISKKISNFFKLPTPQSIGREVESEINRIEIAEHRSKNPIINSVYENELYKGWFYHLMLGGCLWCIFLVSWKVFLIPTVIFFFVDIDIQLHEIPSLQIELGKDLHKKKLQMLKESRVSGVGRTNP